MVFRKYYSGDQKKKDKEMGGARTHMRETLHARSVVGGKHETALHTRRTWEFSLLKPSGIFIYDQV